MRRTRRNATPRLSRRLAERLRTGRPPPVDALAAGVVAVLVPIDGRQVCVAASLIASLLCPCRGRQRAGFGSDSGALPIPKNKRPAQPFVYRLQVTMSTSAALPVGPGPRDMAEPARRGVRTTFVTPRGPNNICADMARLAALITDVRCARSVRGGIGSSVCAGSPRSGGDVCDNNGDVVTTAPG